jgi:hypothetical protein
VIANVHVPVTDDSGELWFVCPIEGERCVRVSSVLGVQMASDVLDIHVLLHHRTWR